MTEIKFDSEGITYCPKNETATIRECLMCNYCKNRTIYLPNGLEACSLHYDCIYLDVFPEPVEVK